MTIFLLRLLLKLRFDWEDTSNIWDSNSSAIQTSRISWKILRCASYFQLSCMSVFGYPDETLSLWYITYSVEYRRFDTLLWTSYMHPELSSKASLITSKILKMKLDWPCWPLPKLQGDTKNLQMTTEWDISCCYKLGHWIMQLQNFRWLSLLYFSFLYLELELKVPIAIDYCVEQLIEQLFSSRLFMISDHYNQLSATCLISYLPPHGVVVKTRKC